MPAPISYGARLRQLAAAHPDRTALVVVPVDGDDVVVSWGQLVADALDMAVGLRDRGAGPGSRVAIGLPNGVDHVATCLATWFVGACALPLNPAAPTLERDHHLALFGPQVVVGAWDDQPSAVAPTALRSGATGDDLPDVVPHPGRAIGTGGSTGKPKIIVQQGPHVYEPSMHRLLEGFGWREGLVHLVAGPLFHSFAFDWCYQGFAADHLIVLLERFDAERAVAAIERHHVHYAGLVPTTMRRIAMLPGIDGRDLSSLEAVMHTGAPCPPEVKQRWIDLIGPTRVIEGYGASEGYGNTVIRGDEWLKHVGSVGRPWSCELRIVGPDGRELPPGVVGEVYMRRAGMSSGYLGSDDPRLTGDGFGSVGDLGWLDEDGYLYLADRRVDLIVSGGSNVYPAEVEAALLEHPAVLDAAVIGLPDEEWGKRVHAVLELHQDHPAPSAAELEQLCRARLTAYKVPKAFEVVTRLPRNEAGKIRRSDLVAARVS